MQGATLPFFRRLPFRPAVLGLSLLALAPVIFVAVNVAAVSRNIVYWDEFDTVLDLLLKLDAGLDFSGFFERIFAINNEHRMLTSRLLFAASWWLTGTVDFRVIGAIGNFFLVGICIILLIWAGTTERRVRLGIILAVLLFQLEHFENLMWSGASIDHFQVVALAVGAIVLLERGSWVAVLGASVLALLATFTLAHGLMAWPVGVLLLWSGRRWRHLAFWVTIGAASAFAFFHNFELNSGHRVAGFDAMGLVRITKYWVSLLGAPLALGYVPLAPFMGIVLLAASGWLAWLGTWRKERVALAVLLFCVGALGLIAIGRSEVAGGLLQSRYMVLSALAWVTMLFVTIERASNPARPFRLLAACLPALAAFNIAANIRFAPVAESFIEGRDGAALRYKQYGQTGHSTFSLYPMPERANHLLAEVAQQGIYWIPRMCVRTDFHDAQPSDRIVYYFDEMTADTRAIYIAGWAAVPKETSRRGQIHLVFRSTKSFIVYSTVAASRPDVAAVHSNPDWRLSGFRFAIGRWRLPPEDFQVGILIKDGNRSEFIMTEHRLRPYGRGEALLANSQ